MVVVNNPELYRLDRIEVNHGKHKYDAVLKNKKTGTEKRVPFGGKKTDGTPYQHYHDKIGHYKSYDHNDRKRRDLYRIRHAGQEKNKFSSGYFSWTYLW